MLGKYEWDEIRMAVSFGYDSEHILYKRPFQTKIDDKKLTTVQDGGRKEFLRDSPRFGKTHKKLRVKENL